MLDPGADLQQPGELGPVVVVAGPLLDELALGTPHRGQRVDDIAHFMSSLGHASTHCRSSAWVCGRAPPRMERTLRHPVEARSRRWPRSRIGARVNAVPRRRAAQERANVSAALL